MKCLASLRLLHFSSLRQAPVACTYSSRFFSTQTPRQLGRTEPRHQQQKRNNHITMATDASFESLAAQFQHLPLLDRYPSSFPDLNPIDIYRSHITSILHEITGVDAGVIYPALQWTATLDKGDLMLAIPALRVKGKPDELGKQWLDKVCLVVVLLLFSIFYSTN